VISQKPLKSLWNLSWVSKLFWYPVRLLDKAKYNVKHNVVTLDCH
jgi:hypothetical protein